MGFPRPLGPASTGVETTFCLHGGATRKVRVVFRPRGRLPGFRPAPPAAFERHHKGKTHYKQLSNLRAWLLGRLWAPAAAGADARAHARTNARDCAHVHVREYIHICMYACIRMLFVVGGWATEECLRASAHLEDAPARVYIYIYMPNIYTHTS